MFISAFKFCLCQHLILLTCISKNLHGNEIKQYLKNYKASKFIKTILESTYKFVLGTYNLVAPSGPSICFKQLLTFRLLQLLLYLEKTSEVMLFRSLKSLKSHIQGHPLRKNGSLKNCKICPFWHILFQKQKQVTFSIFYQSDNSAKAHWFWKLDI